MLGALRSGLSAGEVWTLKHQGLIECETELLHRLGFAAGVCGKTPARLCCLAVVLKGRGLLNVHQACAV